MALVLSLLVGWAPLTVHAAQGYGGCTYSASSYNAISSCDTTSSTSTKSSRLSNTGQSQKLLFAAAGSLVIGTLAFGFLIKKVRTLEARHDYTA